MDYSLPDDDIRIDCMAFIDKFPNPIIMRDVCETKATHQQERSASTMAPPISNMLNDEAPDNFLSSAALEKNIFSDDDEYGLHRLKRIDKNLARPTSWDIEFDTDELIKKDSNLELDLVNFPPPPPLVLPLKMQQRKAEGRASNNNNNAGENRKTYTPYRSDSDDEPEIVYEVDTDRCSLARDTSNGMGCSRRVESPLMHGQSNGSVDQEYDPDEKVQLALNDHNYTVANSQDSKTTRINIDDVLKFLKNDVTPTQKSRIMNMLSPSGGGNGSFDSNFEMMDDDAISNTSTECFYPIGKKVHNEPDEVENSDSENGNAGRTSAEKVQLFTGICKEELFIEEDVEMFDERACKTPNHELEEQADTTKIKRLSAGSESDLPSHDQFDKLDENTKNTNRQLDVQFNSSGLHERQGGGAPSQHSKPSTEEASISSCCFSDNRSEPNEFFETEDNSTDSGEERSKMTQPSTSVSTVNQDNVNLSIIKQEIAKTRKQVIDDRSENASVNMAVDANIVKESTKTTPTCTSTEIEPPSTELQTESGDRTDIVSLSSKELNPKLCELKNFAIRLLDLCNKPKPDTDKNLDELLKELLIDFREIVGKPACADQFIQTEKIYSKRRRTKMNEKAKRKLLNASSSSSSSGSSCESSEDEIEPGDDVAQVASDPVAETATRQDNEESDENVGDEDKLEKSPSYSDLSGRASSEEFLNTDMDDQEHHSDIDDIHLSEHIVRSPSKLDDQGSDDLDLSKYEVNSENASETSKAHDEVSTKGSSQENREDCHSANEEVEKEAAKSGSHESNDEQEILHDGLIDEDHSVPGAACVDEEMPEVENDVISSVDTREVPVNLSDIEDYNSDNDMQCAVNDTHIEKGTIQDIIGKDEKLQLEAMVVVNKMSDEDFEEYYDDLRDKEIEKLLNYSGLIKKRITDNIQIGSDKPQSTARSKVGTKLMEILKEAENEICSDDSISDVEEPTITENDFLKLCNQKAKDEFLQSVSSDSELDKNVSDEDELEIQNLCGYSSSEEEEGPSIVDKFLEKFSCKIEADVSMEEDNAKVEEESNEAQEAGVANIGEPDAEKDGKGAEHIVENHEQNDKNAGSVSVTSDGIHLNDFGGESSADSLSDDIVLVNDIVNDQMQKEVVKEKSDDENSTTSMAKPSTSFGIRSVRSLLSNDKEIDIDAIEKETVPVPEDIDDNSDKSLARRPAVSKDLETLIEESRRRQTAKSSDNVVTLDSDSDLEEITTETEAATRTIKPMLRKDQLAGETRTAQRRENERIKRLEKKNEMLAKVLDEYQTNLNKLNPGSTEKELVLDYLSESKTFIKVHPDIVKHLKEHQFEGIKFMYDNTYGSADHLKKHPGSGCILAHCMGLGKTLQIVALLYTVINYKELDTSKILVLCPKSTIMNWADEIRRWLGPVKSNTMKIFTFNDTSPCSIEDKIKILHEWSSSGKPGFRKAGCLLLGYEAFRMLVFNPLHKKKIVSEVQLEKIKKKIRDTLLKPGADLVICDEGHIIKNRKSATSLAVSEISTTRRIILTGTPIQNNLKEYYAMVNFIKPKFLGTEKEFANLYENPIRNGQHKDSNKRDIKIMKQRSFVLHKKLSKFVQRREAALLKTFLPMKFEYVLFIPMTEVQIKLYEFFLEVSSKREGSKGKNLIPDYTCLRKIWTHPRVLENAWKNAMVKKRDNKKSPIREPTSDDEIPDDEYDTQTGALSVTDDWWRSLLSEENLKSILPSSKLQVMFEILRICEENGEKCLIFSAFVAVLDCVEYFMNEIMKQGEEARQYGLTTYRGQWISGKDYYRLDGKTPKNIRHEMVKRFNDPKMTRARAFLISAKAGGQGINLVGANRVIILDTSWNPSNDQQNIFRIFRLGQKKQCYVYRLLAMGTMEEKVYSRSVTKQAMSFRVVDEQQIDRHYSITELSELYTLTKPDFQNRPVPPLPQDSLLASLLHNSPHLVYKYHEHDSLLENKLEQELSEQEKADAWEAYEREQSSQNLEFMPGLNNMPSLYPNPAYMPPGMGFGFPPPDRNYPMGYGSNLPPPGYFSSLGYTGNSSLLDMLKMFPAAPPTNPLITSLNPNAVASTQGNLLHTYGSPVSSSNSLPMNYPPYNTMASMSGGSALGPLPPFSPSFSPVDPAIFRLSQMYSASLGASGGGANMPRVDNRSPSSGGSSNGSPSTSAALEKRNSPFPTGLFPPTTTTTESIPTSVIKPPQAHSASMARHTMPTPSLSQQLATHYMKSGSSGNSDIPTLHQQLLAQSNLPPLPQNMSPLPHSLQSQGLHSLLQNPIPSARNTEASFSQADTSLTKSHTTTTSVASAVPSLISSIATMGTNRNNSPLTVSARNSPKLNSTGPTNAQRSTNMGIVYPHPPDNNSATITPIITSVASLAPVSAGGTSISVRSVSSINNNAPNTRNTIPATIIQKPGAVIPANLSSLLKQNNPTNPGGPVSGNSSLTVSPVGKTTKVLNFPKQTPASGAEKSPAPSTLATIGRPPKKQDKNKIHPTGAVLDKSAIQNLGLNNVQLTKVPNNRSILSKPQSNQIPKQSSPQGNVRHPGAATQMPPGAITSVITKARSNSALTVLPVANSNNTNSGKLLQNTNSNVVPTLVPLSSKSKAGTVASRPAAGLASAKSVDPSSPNISSVNLTRVASYSTRPTPRPVKNPLPNIMKKPPNKIVRSASFATKPVGQPPMSASATVPPTSAFKRAVSLSNLPAPKQPRTSLPNSQVTRPPSSLLASQQVPPGRPVSMISGKSTNPTLATSSLSTSNPNISSNKNSLSIRSIDAINKFANAGITISPGRSKGGGVSPNVLGNVMNQGNSNIKHVNSVSAGNISNLSNSVTLSKVGGPTSRKRPPTNVNPNSNAATAGQVKKPRLAQTVPDRNVAESLLRARSNQGLTIMLKNPQGNQKTNKDGKITDVVEID